MWAPRPLLASARLERVVDPDVLATALAHQAAEHATRAIEHEARGDAAPAADCYRTAAALLERAALGSRHAGHFSSRAHEYSARAELLSNPTEPRRIEQVFGMMDANSSGGLDRAEFREGVQLLFASQSRGSAVGVAQWGVDEVELWLRTGAGVTQETAALMKKAGVHGELLMHLSAEDLEEIGIEERLERKKILAHIDQLAGQSVRVQPSVTAASAGGAQLAAELRSPQPEPKKAQPEPEPEPEPESEPDSRSSTDSDDGAEAGRGDVAARARGLWQRSRTLRRSSPDDAVAAAASAFQAAARSAVPAEADASTDPRAAQPASVMAFFEQQEAAGALQRPLPSQSAVAQRLAAAQRPSAGADAAAGMHHRGASSAAEEWNRFSARWQAAQEGTDESPSSAAAAPNPAVGMANGSRETSARERAQPRDAGARAAMAEQRAKPEQDGGGQLGQPASVLAFFAEQEKAGALGAAAASDATEARAGRPKPEEAPTLAPAQDEAVAHDHAGDDKGEEWLSPAGRVLLEVENRPGLSPLELRRAMAAERTRPIRQPEPAADTEVREEPRAREGGTARGAGSLLVSELDLGTFSPAAFRPRPKTELRKPSRADALSGRPTPEARASLASSRGGGGAEAEAATEKLSLEPEAPSAVRRWVERKPPPGFEWAGT